MRKYTHLMVIGGLIAFGAGCGSSGNKDGGGDDGGVGCGAAPVELCQTPGSEVALPGDISVDTNLSSDCTYTISGENTFVTACTTSIEAGTTIEGTGGFAFVVTQNGRVEAVGTASEPIVFTSGVPEGSRAAGNWGGVVLLGTAPLSWGNSTCDGTMGNCVANIEGLAPTVNEGLFGGDDPGHDCGTLRYVRIEFAGNELSQDNELNGLSVGGCGTGTELSYIQVHRGLDDGVEFFGGTVTIDHLVVSGTGDDGLDWDQGWQGGADHFVVHHFAGSSEDPRGIEADNNKNDPPSAPRSNPTIECGTLIADDGATADRGVLLRRGTLGRLDRLIITGFPSAGFDIRNKEEGSTVNLEDDWPDNLVLENSYLYENNPDYASGKSDDADDQSFPEPTRAGAGALDNTTGVDPDFGDIDGATDNSSAPDYRADGITDAGAFCDTTTNWLADWTDFPEN